MRLSHRKTAFICFDSDGQQKIELPEWRKVVKYLNLKAFRANV